MSKILIVDDEEIIRNLFEHIYIEHGYDCKAVANGKDFLRQLSIYKPDLLIIDYQLPDMNGHEICTKVREKLRIPIIMVTAHNSDSNMFKGFDLGIDDFISKPFKPLELIARTKAILKRAENNLQKSIEKAEIITFDDHQFYPLERKIINPDKKIILLSEYETKILSLLIKKNDKEVTYKEIHTAIGSYSDDSGFEAIRVYVSRLRKKIDSKLIQNIRYKGYIFAANNIQIKK